MSQQERNDADHATAEVVREAFGRVQMALPVPEPAAALDGAGHGERRRWLTAAASVAAAATALTVAITTLGGGGSAAWAAVPAAPSDSDVTQAVSECRWPLGGQSDRTEALAPPVAIAESSLVVLDIRGDGAVALFDDGRYSASCGLVRADGSWRYAGLEVSDRERVGTSGVTSVSSTTLPDGRIFSTVRGHLDAAASKVVVALPDGTTAEASLGIRGAGQVFAAWFPVPIEDIAGATVTAYDASGQATALPAVEAGAARADAGGEGAGDDGEATNSRKG